MNKPTRICLATLPIALVYAPLLPSGAAGAEASSKTEPSLRTLHAQPSFVLSNKEVEVAVTRTGGHTAPVTFLRDTAHPIQPYHISPWQDEPASQMPVPVLVPLRGDFFCLPFGGNADALAGEKHPPHGEVAGSEWSFVGKKSEGDVSTLSLSFNSTVRKGRILKELSLVNGHNVLYSSHTLEGFSGRMPLGHHATLAMPEKEGSVRIATSPFSFGMTYPGLFSDPRLREYQFLLPGARWTDLSKVPAAWKNAPDADLTCMPGAQGYADLVQFNSLPWEQTGGPAWITATYSDAGYVWFALKDQAVLRSTVFWMENRGRHSHPWNGRNNCLGLEDVTAHFADGLAPSVAENVLSRAGIPTTLELNEKTPTVVRYIQGVVRIPRDFGHVKAIRFSPGTVVFLSTGGKQVTATVHHEFLKSGKL